MFLQHLIRRFVDLNRFQYHWIYAHENKTDRLNIMVNVVLRHVRSLKENNSVIDRAQQRRENLSFLKNK